MPTSGPNEMRDENVGLSRLLVKQRILWLPCLKQAPSPDLLLERKAKYLLGAP